MLLESWRKFKGWKVIEFFLKEQEKIHVKGLARRLKISPRTAQTYLKIYYNEGILEKEAIGNMLFYRLNNTFVTLELKKAYFLMLIHNDIENFIKDNPNISSLILYGSHADGSYDKSSDVDLLIISQTKKLDNKNLRSLEEKVGKEVTTETFSIGETRKMSREGNNFYLSVLKNNVLLYGSRL